MKLNKFLLIFTLIFTSFILTGCFSNENNIDVQNPNTWDKKNYKKGYKKVEKDLNEILNRNRNSTEPSTLLWGFITDHNYVAEDEQGNYQITVLVTGLERFSKSQIETTAIDYKEINKYLNNKIDKAVEKGEIPDITVHDMVKIKKLKYIYHMDKENNILSVDVR